MNLLLTILAVLLWVWALVDLLRRPTVDPSKKILWLLAILIFPILGAILYFLLNKPATGRRFRLPPKS